MNRLKNNWGKVALVTSVIVGGSQSAFATDPTTFDYTTLSTVLTTGLGVVATVAAGIAAIKAGVIVWKKIASYFNRAG